MRVRVITITDHVTRMSAQPAGLYPPIDNVADYLDGQVRVQTDDTSMTLAVALATGKARDQQAARRRLGDRLFRSITIQVNVITCDMRVLESDDDTGSRRIEGA